ncbi:transcriptional regulator [Xenorhabdus sp. PB62.4]|nr:transcriptional regulator [Xenorhabdus sp. PB62.4]
MNNVGKDWHQADIIAALCKRGTTLVSVFREAGLSSSTLANALSRQWPNTHLIKMIVHLKNTENHKTSLQTFNSVLSALRGVWD